MKRALSYFELKRGKHYTCCFDSPDYNGKFVYRLHKHYLVYRKVEGEWDYHKGRVSRAWRGVWNPLFYDESRASFREVRILKSRKKKGGQ